MLRRIDDSLRPRSACALARLAPLTAAIFVAAGAIACGGGDESGAGAAGGSAGAGTGGSSSSSTGSGLFGGGGSGGKGPWAPPIGIPAPDFGVHDKAPAAPSPWNAPTPGFYYVDASAPGSTDDGNPFGTPAHPRASIPIQVPAGGVVELHGSYVRSHSSPATLVLSGTADRPVFIRGVDADHKPAIGNGWEVTGTYYVLENLDFGPTPDKTMTGSLVMREPTSHGVLRDSEVHGLLGGGGMGIVVWTPAGVVDHVLVFRNYIHDNGDVHDTHDQDAHGIAVGNDVSYLWVLENEMARNSGDGIQINAGSHAAAPSLHHVYVGRNVSHENKQTGFWVKQAVDVIFSQNVSYGHHASSSAPGDGMGSQYNPDYVWFLDNVVYQCDFGIGAHSNLEEDNPYDTHLYYIGNLIAGIHAGASGFDASSAWSMGGGLMLMGGFERYVVNNTFVDVASAIDSPATYGKLVIENNLVASVADPKGGHVFIEDPGVAAASTIDHELFDGAVKIRWGDYNPMGLGAFKSAFPTKCQGCVAAPADFVDLAQGDLHPKAGAAAVDAGVVSGVYATFRDRYGIDIAADITGAPRPQGHGWDIGAFERTP